MVKGKVTSRSEALQARIAFSPFRHRCSPYYQQRQCVWPCIGVKIILKSDVISNNERRNKKWGDEWGFILLLTVVVLGVFAKVAFGLNTFFYRDFASLGYPYAAYLRDSLWNGELPFWNPYSHCGVPFLAQMGNWYPPALLSLLFPIPWATNCFVLLHLIWGGWGVYWLSRRWGAGNFPAQVAGFAFVFNGVTFSCMVWGNYIASLAWLPWVTGCVMAAWQFGGQWIAVAALVSALQVLTATPEITIVYWLMLGILWTAAVISQQVKPGVAARRLAAVIILAAGITMVQMLPFFDLLTHSQRDTARAESFMWAMPGWGWANLFVPLFHTYRAPQGQWFQPGQDFLVSYYIGVGAMVLAVIGLLLKRSRTFLIIGGVALFCWVLALGMDGFLFGWIWKIFPLIGIARFPVKYAILTAFLLPLLVAWGIESIQSANQQRARVVIIVTTGALFLTALFVAIAYLHPFPDDNWRATAANAGVRSVLMLIVVGGVWLQSKLASSRGKTAVQLLVLAVFPLDAFTHNQRLVPTLPAANLAPGIWQLSGKPPPPRLGEGRIMISPGAEQVLSFSHVEDFAMDLTGKRLAEWYNLNMLDRIPKVAGAITLRPAHFDVVERHLYYTSGATFGEPLMDFLSATWISSPTNPVVWLSRTNALPIITAGQQPVFTNTTEIWRAMTANDFAPRRFVYLPEAAQGLVSVSAQTDCVVRDVSFGQNQVAFATEATRPSMVVISQTHYHLWNAMVDGNSVPLFRANQAFQALEVPAGSHRVELVYRDPYFTSGVAVSVASLAACGLIWSRSRRLGHPA